MKTANMLRSAVSCAGVAALLAICTGCQGRTDANMEPNGDTVEVKCDTIMPDQSLSNDHNHE